MRLGISSTGQNFVERRTFHGPHYSEIDSYEKDLRRIDRLIRDLNQRRILRRALSQEISRLKMRTPSFRGGVKLFILELRLFSQIRKCVDLKFDIEEIEDPVRRLCFHSFKLGEALFRWVSTYNHLVEGLRLGQLPDDQVAVVERAYPVLKRAIDYFERCVELYHWHKEHKKKGRNPLAPVVGLELRELQEVVEQLGFAVSLDALDVLRANSDSEVSLIELEKELGELSPAT